MGNEDFHGHNPRDAIAKLQKSFWHSEFNEDNEGNYQSEDINPIGDLAKWEAWTDKNPLFVLGIRWKNSSDFNDPLTVDVATFHLISPTGKKIHLLTR